MNTIASSFRYPTGHKHAFTHHMTYMMTIHIVHILYILYMYGLHVAAGAQVSGAGRSPGRAAQPHHSGGLQAAKGRSVTVD